ncbi:hypothetical protein EK21DRAFT_84658 [Setomelanomma holmii]|uniref:Uncharacterized protein n=1 Tax=Setomelanomma holmii TaxID=210430 RepID=A0A9P4LTB9_9PLEO|nr:hypothetical protein EK21DRAFT_84658 [Setomelanomma holmii]
MTIALIERVLPLRSPRRHQRKPNAEHSPPDQFTSEACSTSPNPANKDQKNYGPDQAQAGDFAEPSKSSAKRKQEQGDADMTGVEQPVENDSYDSFHDSPPLKRSEQESLKPDYSSRSLPKIRGSLLKKGLHTPTSRVHLQPDHNISSQGSRAYNQKIVKDDIVNHDDLPRNGTSYASMVTAGPSASILPREIAVPDRTSLATGGRDLAFEVRKTPGGRDLTAVNILLLHPIPDAGWTDSKKPLRVHTVSFSTSSAPPKLVQPNTGAINLTMPSSTSAAAIPGSARKIFKTVFLTERPEKRISELAERLG